VSITVLELLAEATLVRVDKRNGMWFTTDMTTTCTTEPARLLLVTGEVVDGTFYVEPSNFTTPARPGKVYAVYSVRPDGVLLVRADHYRKAAV
jgi:hypothetical protein